MRASFASGGDLRIERAVQPQRDVGILGRVLGRAASTSTWSKQICPAPLPHTSSYGDRLPRRGGATRGCPCRAGDALRARYDWSSVSCATPSSDEPVVHERVLVVLRRSGRPSRAPDPANHGASSREDALAVELVGRAGIAVRERDVARAPGRDRERQAARSRRCIGSRLVVSVSNATSSALRGSPASSARTTPRRARSRTRGRPACRVGTWSPRSGSKRRVSASARARVGDRAGGVHRRAGRLPPAASRSQL